MRTYRRSAKRLAPIRQGGLPGARPVDLVLLRLRIEPGNGRTDRSLVAAAHRETRSGHEGPSGVRVRRPEWNKVLRRENRHSAGIFRLETARDTGIRPVRLHALVRMCGRQGDGYFVRYGRRTMADSASRRSQGAEDVMAVRSGNAVASSGLNVSPMRPRSSVGHGRIGRLRRQDGPWT